MVHAAVGLRVRSSYHILVVVGFVLYYRHNLSRHSVNQLAFIFYLTGCLSLVHQVGLVAQKRALGRTGVGICRPD